MAVDKLVDSTQLDSDLTSVANVIRTKGGTSAQLAFPADFVSAINAISVGDPYDMARKVLSNTADFEYIDGSLTALRKEAFMDATHLTKFIAHGPSTLNQSAFSGCNALSHGIAFPNASGGMGNAMFFNCTLLPAVDLGPNLTGLNNQEFSGCAAMSTLILRRSTSCVTLANVNTFANTPFASGGTGGTIYIPKALYDHLGDNSSSDYKHATNWTTVDGYGTITWEKIEGSIYETQYADGSTI